MPVVPSFAQLFQPLRAVFTAPTFDSLLVIVRGWLFAPRHTITNAILFAQAVGLKHHSAFHRVFASAQWSLDELGLCVFSLILAGLRSLGGHKTGPVMLAVDDSLARKHGRKVHGAGMHHDPLLSSRGMAVMNYGHSWVVLGVLVRCSRLPCLMGRTFCLPILLRLYRNHKTLGQDDQNAYRTRPELFVQMLTLLCRRFPDVRFHAVGDSAYSGKDVIKALPDNSDFTGRLPIDARLYGPVPERRPGALGRPRVRGERLASPLQMLQGKTTPLCLYLYGRKETSRIAPCVAHLYHLPNRPMCVVAVRPDSEKRPDQAFFSTVSEALPTQVLQWYASRWAIEMTFEEAKGELGFEEPPGWSEPAVLRTAPFIMLLYSLIVLWFVQVGHRSYKPPNRPWYPDKQRASFADMLRTLRTEAVTLQVLSLPLPEHTREKTLQAFCTALQC